MEKEEQKRLFGGGSQPRKRNVFTLSEASLSSLSKDDQDMIHEMESEFKRKNNFQRIYPSFAQEVNDYYAQFFEDQRYNNTLCNVWIAACAKGRRPMLTKPANKKNNKQKRGSSVGNSSGEIGEETGVGNTIAAFSYVLVLRRWCNLRPERSFRCFFGKNAETRKMKK